MMLPTTILWCAPPFSLSLLSGYSTSKLSNSASTDTCKSSIKHSQNLPSPPPQMSPMKPHLLLLLLLPLQALATCTCSTNPDSRDTTKALYLKLIAIASILTAGALGILIPILGRSISFLQPEHTGFFIIKAFAAGVILATGLIHILPEAFERLTSPCLGNPHHRFPFAGFIAMVSALATMMIDASATSYYKRSQMNKARPVEEDEDSERAGEAAAPPPEHAGVHGSHGHAYGSPQDEGIRNRVISQVLELGIVVHSVIIGFSLGSSMRPSTIRTLVGALSFHQLFEGIGLGGCIVQANYRARSTMMMATFFSLTAPFGIMLGILTASSYDPKSSTALIIEGGFGAASAGILIYMALVDFLAADFMNPRMQSSGRLQLGANVAVMIGCGLMSLLAKWA